MGDDDQVSSPTDHLHERRLSLIVEHFPIAVLLETSDRKVAQTNQAFCDMFAVPVPPEVLVGADCQQAAVQLAPLWGDLEAFLARVDELLTAGDPVVGERIELTDGRVLERDFLMIPVSGERGEATWIYRDITAIDAARRAAEDEAGRRSELLATISHDVRTPVVGMIGMVDLLLQEPLDPRTRELVESVQGSARGTTTMLDNVLDLARTESGRLELVAMETSVCDLVESVAGMVGPAAQAKSLPLIASAMPGLPEMITTDPGRLRQVVLNLVSNAVKFTASGAVTVVADRAGEDLLITVTDTGPGMPQEAIHSLFEEYFQGGSSVHRAHGGAGLGLAIANRLSAALGASIGIESTLGRGSAFTVRLPGAISGDVATSSPLDLVAHVSGPPIAVSAVAAGLTRLGIDVRSDGADPGITVDVVVTGSIDEAQRVLPQAPGRRLLILVPVAVATCPPLAGRAVALPWTRDRLAAALRDDWEVMTPGPGAPLPAGTRVLLAEDEPSNRRILAEMLSRLGAAVVAVGDGLEAVEAVAADRFDVVMLDLSMPVMGGREAAAEIQVRIPADRRPPVLALTADVAADPAILARSGFAGQLRKPTTSAELRTAITAVTSANGSPSMRMGEGPPVDAEILRELADDLGDPGVVTQTLDIYLEELPGRLDAMTDGMSSDRFDVVREAAHALKSSSRMLGAVALSDLCRDLEAVTAAQSRSGISSGGDLTPTVDALHAEALRVAQWLADFRDAGYPGLIGAVASSGA